ncbi:MAG: NADH-quinone oxidoreductase, subunit [Fibrobacteres bacterium]|nr:NADH-quinone oxidoreductase, subunit [Fibrobacterota bacterium]
MNKANPGGEPGHHDPAAQYLADLTGGSGMPGGLPAIPGVEGSGGLTNAVDWVVGWARANSLWPLVFGTSCCAIEMMATGASHNDWARFGLEVARASPRQADLIILAGTIVEKMGSRLITLYEQMPGPKYVIAMGACTISGGPFYYDSYSVVKGADRLIPVDVYVPGCPPRPEALLFGVMKLQELIRKGGWRNSLTPRPINHSPIKDEMSETARLWEEKEKAKQEGMKEAQERFKAENPDFKGVVIKRVAAPKFDEVPRVVRSQRGLPAPETFAILAERFPGLMVQGLSEPTPEKLAALGPEYILDVIVGREDYLGLVGFLKSDARLKLDFLIELTAVDWKDRFDVVVHLQSLEKGHKVFLRCALPREEHPEIPSLTGIFSGADWHEREAYDFFGIRFAGHPDLRRLFLDDDFPGHPLRKDFEDPSRIVKRPY